MARFAQRLRITPRSLILKGGRSEPVVMPAPCPIDRQTTGNRGYSRAGTSPNHLASQLTGLHAVSGQTRRHPDTERSLVQSQYRPPQVKPCMRQTAMCRRPESLTRQLRPRRRRRWRRLPARASGAPSIDCPIFIWLGFLGHSRHHVPESPVRAPIREPPDGQLAENAAEHEHRRRGGQGAGLT